MTTRRDALRSAALLPLAAFPGVVRATPRLSSSCVAGHLTHDSVRLWLQAQAPGRGTLAYWPAAASESDAKRVGFTLEPGRQDSTIVDLAKLESGSFYRYRVQLEGGDWSPTPVFRTLRAPGGAPRAFRLYTGSCCYSESHTRSGNPYGDEFQVFDTMAGQMRADALPHLMLWLGDNLYLRRGNSAGALDEYGSVELMEGRYRSVRAKSFLQGVLAATHHYAIWDDHDYGPDNADRHFPLKDDSLRLFRTYWPNAEMGSAALPGTGSRFVHEDAEFFLLDGRWNRDPEKAPATADKAMYGARQMAWLREGLAASKATFKLIAGGSQFLSENKLGVHSGWHSYPAERDDFLAYLARTKIPGVVLLSGDRHNTQVFRLEREGAAPVYEYSCSPFTSRLSKLTEADWANPRLVRECVVEQRGFGTLVFSGAPGARRVVACAHDTSGKVLWEKALAGAA